MKTYLSYIFILTAVFLTSCKDFLSEKNISNVEAEEYYLTAEGYPSIVNASYAALRPVFNEPWVFSAGTDLFVEGRNAQPAGISEYRNLTGDEASVTNFYRNSYSAIQVCNNALFFNDKTASNSNLGIRKGEVKFLRAYVYFLLVQSFGGVPLVTERFSAPVVQFKRNDAQEVYDFIIGEMNEALTLVPDVQSDFGRVNKRTIRHFLAKVHLTRGYESFRSTAGKAEDFQAAATFADAAINSQALTLPFESVFTPGNEKNAEIIFSLQYDPVSIVNQTSGGNSQNYWFGPYMGGQGATEGYPNRAYQLVPTMHLFDLFSSADSRFDATFMIEYYQRYYDYYDKANDRANLNVKFYYAPKWASGTLDIAAWRAVNPARRNATTVIPYSTAWEASPTTGPDNAVPAIKKFDDPKAAFGTSSSTRDIFLARLAETYLIAAEAYLQLNKLPEAVSRINVVRKRAAKPSANLDIDQSQLSIDFILDERARELAGEYHRWFDLKRTGKLIERTKKYNRDIKEWFDALPGLVNGPFEGVNGGLKILRPIPNTALILNEAGMQQNPGY